MRNGFSVLGLGLAIGVVCGCSLDVAAPGFKKSVHTDGGSGSTTYSYDFTVNGCATGSKSFTDKSQYCATLHDDAANNGCARELRDREYADNCR